MSSAIIVVSVVRLFVYILLFIIDTHEFPSRYSMGNFIMASGFRGPGGQYKRYKDCLKSTMTQCGITPSELETLAMDRAGWRFSCRRVRSTTHSGVGGQTGSAQIWSTIHEQLRVPDLPPDVSLTDWAPCPQHVTLVMRRPVVSTAQSMTFNLNICVSALKTKTLCY